MNPVHGKWYAMRDIEDEPYEFQMVVPTPVRVLGDKLHWGGRAPYTMASLLGTRYELLAELSGRRDIDRQMECYRLATLPHWDAAGLIEHNKAHPRDCCSHLCGFIDPVGVFWQGSSFGHTEQADALVPLFLDEGFLGDRDPESHLYNAGWFSVHHTGIISGGDAQLKPAQMAVVEVLAAFADEMTSTPNSFSGRFAEAIRACLTVREPIPPNVVLTPPGRRASRPVAK